MVSLGIIDSVPNYQSVMVDYLNKQLLLTRSAVEERIGPFRELLVTTVDALEADVQVDPKAQAEVAQTMSNMNEEMIRRMQYVESRFRELDGLGAAGARTAGAACTAGAEIWGEAVTAGAGRRSAGGSNSMV